MTSTPSWTKVDSVASIVDKYDGFILDQFGVMHNGVHALEGADECVQKLAEAKKKLIILSNSSSPSSSTIGKLPKLGYDPVHFLDAVTSGEEASKYVKEKYGGKKALFITWKVEKNNTPKPAVFLEAVGDLTITTNVDEADFVLLHGVDVLRGPDGEETDLGNFFKLGAFDGTPLDALLEKAAGRQLQVVCCNPDYISVQPDNSQAHMPGAIARRYEQHYKGSVISFGKPHKEHFQACIDRLGLAPEKICHVGDSLHHDVCGANASGVDSLFVTSGVHCDEMSSSFGQMPPDEKLEELFAKHGEVPTYVTPLFRM